jgi:hypothetical protein
MDFLEFCLDRAKWCIINSEEPIEATIAWLNTFNDNLPDEIKALH